MKTLKDLKEAINKDKELKNRFMNLKSREEAVILAHDMGYEISVEEIENDEEINEDLLESVAGGGIKSVKSVDVKSTDIALGKGSKVDNKANINETIDRFKSLEEQYRR